MRRRNSTPMSAHAARREKRSVSMLDLAHHAFSRAIDISLPVIGFLSLWICRCPVEFQAMRIALKNKVNLFNGNGFCPYHFRPQVKIDEAA